MGSIAIVLSGEAPSIEKLPLTIVTPIIQNPIFTWTAMVAHIFLLIITILADQNSRGISGLSGAGHKPPEDLIATLRGIGSLITGMFGSISSCLTGPTNAILVTSGINQRGQYTTTIFLCIGVMIFGLFSILEQ